MVKRCQQEAHWIINTSQDTHYYCCADHVDEMMKEKCGAILTWLEDVGITCEKVVVTK